MKKRHIYATVMIDIETRKIIDILDSRDLEDVIEWLKTYPNLKIISRDGSLTYAAAIKKSHPKAIQISDRFHLLKNLTDYCKSYITKIMNFKIKIKSSSGENKVDTVTNSFFKRNDRIKEAQSLYSKGLSQREIGLQLKMDIRTVKKYINLNTEEIKKDATQIRHEESTNKKQKKIDMVRELYNKGYGIRQISRTTGLARSTIRKYLAPNAKAVHASYGETRVSYLAQFHSMIDELLANRETFKNIEETIRNKGYNGSASAIRMYTARKRKLIKEVIKSDEVKYELVDRKYLIKLLYKPIESIKELSRELLEKVFKEYPTLSEIYKLNTSFKEVLFSNNSNGLNTWIDSAKSLNISDINSFINGITNDIEAVKNAIIYKYSNGLAEGSVNKIKVIKRIMYGRCSFDTLRRKVLHLEKFREIN
jgi:transposase